MSGKKEGGKRDDSYFAADRRRRNKTMIIAAGVGVAVVIAAVAAVLAYQGDKSQTEAFGPVGSAHEHAVFAVKLDGQPVDFSQRKYQVQSNYIHVEGGDGTTLHRHATGVPFAEFLKSVKMDINGNCFIRDDGMQFCNEGDKMLKFYINGEKVDSIMDYIIREDDRVLVIYGNESDAQIQIEINALKNTPKKTQT